MAMLPPKDTRELLYRMLQGGFVFLQVRAYHLKLMLCVVTGRFVLCILNLTEWVGRLLCYCKTTSLELHAQQARVRCSCTRVHGAGHASIVVRMARTRALNVRTPGLCICAHGHDAGHTHDTALAHTALVHTTPMMQHLCTRP